jgi:hypothetical protein
MRSLAGICGCIWRGITTSYLMKEKPDLFRKAMDRLTW